jgi:hypothetical protein
MEKIRKIGLFTREDSEKEKKKIEPFLATGVILLRTIRVAIGISGWSVEIGERADSASSTG